MNSSPSWADCEAWIRDHCGFQGSPVPEQSILYAHVLWTFAECIAAKKILEIGIGPTCVSGSTWIHSMARRGGGYLLSIDIEPDRPAELYREKAKELGTYWAVFHGDSLKIAQDIPQQCYGADILYVDGDHIAEYAYGDTVNFLPCLRDGGYLIIDDFPGFDGVRDAAGRLNREGFQFVHLSHEPPHGNGRLVWQKPRTWERR